MYMYIIPFPGNHCTYVRLFVLFFRVEAIYPVSINTESMKIDSRIASLYQYAVKVEKSMFETANSRVREIF